MKKVLLLIFVLLLTSNEMFAQRSGGHRAIRIQAVGGFQNGIGGDIEYTLPFNANRIGVRVGYATLPFSVADVSVADLKSEFDLNTSTIDFGAKYYFGGEGYGFFLGVDFALDSKNIMFSNIEGTTSEFEGMKSDEPVTISEGELDETITSTIITPKIGWTKISSNGFTWSFELGYSLLSVDPLDATVRAKNSATNQFESFTYRYENVYEEILGMSAIPYIRVGFGYSIRLGRKA